MKKSYIIPQTLVVELENESVMTGTQTFRTTLNNQVASSVTNNEGEDDNQFAASYRSNLWGDE